jgi:membrane protein DedA with SNARE-associated domain
VPYSRSVDEALRRRRLTFLLAPIAVLVVMSNVGSALAPTLVKESPLLLLALDARIRHVVLVAGELDAIPYYAVGTLRLLLSDPLFYLLGYWYGEAALSWVERKSGSIGRFLREMEGFFGKATYPLVFLAPNNYICLFAGAARMHPAVFLFLNVSGTLTRLALIRYVGDVFGGAREAVLGFIGDYQIPLTVLTITLVVGQALWEKRKGTGELEELKELDRELEHADPRPEDAPGIDLAERAEHAGENPPGPPDSDRA